MGTFSDDMKAQTARSGRWPDLISRFRTIIRPVSHKPTSPECTSARRSDLAGLAIRELPGPIGRSRFLCRLVAVLVATSSSAGAASLTGSFTSTPQGANVNLTVEGPIDWVHWGLYTESSLDRKAGVTPLISDFTVVYAPNAYAYVYPFADNYNGYSWSDGTPTASVTNTPTGVWAYGVPTRNSGFQFTVPADTTLRTLKVYVGAFAARGNFEASLSDNSASAYSDIILDNLGNGPSGVYSISYAAQSAGQSLTIKWTLTMQHRPDANVTLQAAALSAPGANNPPSVTITSPSDNADFSAGSNITISAGASDSDGTIAKVEFFQGAAKLGESSSSPYSLTWSNVPPGNYLLTARALDNGGATRTSAPVEVFVNGTGGMLSSSAAFPAASVDLTAEGASDWAHWGLVSPASFDHKANVPQQISNFTKIGTNDTQRLQDNFSAFTWSDGIPTASTNDTKTGVFTSGLTNGFLLSAPADTNSRTLKVYVGLYGGEGKFQAYLSDFSAPAYTDTSMRGLTVYDNAYTNYTLDYRAASSGQMLIVKFTARILFDADYGNVSLETATLSGANLPTNAPPTVAITSPLNNATFVAPANITITADASDRDGSITLVEFFQNDTILGAVTNMPYSFSWTHVTAGNYTLTVKATDNLGAATGSGPVAISVTNSTPLAVVIENPGVSDGALHFSFATQAGLNYTVQLTDSLNPVNWQVATNFTSAGATVSVTNTTAVAERFYRVGAQ